MIDSSLFSRGWVLPPDGSAQTDSDRAQAIVRVRCINYLFKVAVSGTRQMYLSDRSDHLASVTVDDRIRLVNAFNRGIRYLGIAEYKVTASSPKQAVDQMEIACVALSNQFTLRELFKGRRVVDLVAEAAAAYTTGSNRQRRIVFEGGAVFGLTPMPTDVVKGRRGMPLVFVGVLFGAGATLMWRYRATLVHLTSHIRHSWSPNKV